MSFYIYLIILFSSVGLCKLYIDNGKKKKHEFWDIQPVSRTSTSINKTDGSLIINPKDWKSLSQVLIDNPIPTIPRLAKKATGTIRSIRQIKLTS